ncbi:hypothetical protein V9L05_20600 [Bernardetia sp. Wsw4-3y2]|uniref:hypothetical protein n=1 Tax=Bernardetia sp. Wsw4-3y2 TaxID=3127471 RepID=UPI0030CDF20B
MNDKTKVLLQKCFKKHPKETKMLLVNDKPFLLRFADIAENYATKTGAKVETITQESLEEKQVTTLKTETKDNAKSESKK